jgi:hypothetical protein
MQRKESSILWIEGLGFSSLIGLSWLTEAVRIPHFIFDETFTPHWNRALLRTLVIILAWAWVHLATRRLLKRLHYLEDFLRLCGWCRRVCHDGEWMEFEKFYNSKFATQTTHGMCPDCLEKSKLEIKTAQYPPPPAPGK